MSGHLWPLKHGGTTGSLVPSKVGGSLRRSAHGGGTGRRGRGEAATWPRAEMQALSNGLTSGGFEGTGAHLRSDGTLF